MEQKTRFSYFENLLAAPSPLGAGETEPKTLAQVARRFGVNPGFLEQWVEEMGRSKGAPHSILFAWFAFGAGQSNEGWTSPAARLFRDFKPKTREQLAERYQEFFLDAMKKWQALEATRKKEPEPENDL